eukprot:XP_020406519.1 glycine-rich protein DOT1-like [Zea mays]
MSGLRERRRGRAGNGRHGRATATLRRAAGHTSVPTSTPGRGGRDRVGRGEAEPRGGGLGAGPNAAARRRGHGGGGGSTAAPGRASAVGDGRARAHHGRPAKTRGRRGWGRARAPRPPWLRAESRRAPPRATASRHGRADRTGGGGRAPRAGGAAPGSRAMAVGAMAASSEGGHDCATGRASEEKQALAASRDNLDRLYRDANNSLTILEGATALL